MFLNSKFLIKTICLWWQGIMETISRYLAISFSLRPLLMNIQNVGVYLYLNFTCWIGTAIQINCLEEASTFSELYCRPGCRRSGELPACRCMGNCETEGRCLLEASYTWVLMMRDKFCTLKIWFKSKTWKFGHHLVIFKNTLKTELTNLTDMADISM